MIRTGLRGTGGSPLHGVLQGLRVGSLSKADRGCSHDHRDGEADDLEHGVLPDKDGDDPGERHDRDRRRRSRAGPPA